MIYFVLFTKIIKSKVQNLTELKTLSLLFLSKTKNLRRITRLRIISTFIQLEPRGVFNACPKGMVFYSIYGKNFNSKLFIGYTGLCMHDIREQLNLKGFLLVTQIV